MKERGGFSSSVWIDSVGNGPMTKAEEEDDSMLENRPIQASRNFLRASGARIPCWLIPQRLLFAQGFAGCACRDATP